jgi:uncharacterized protein (TIGR03435 family)
MYRRSIMLFGTVHLKSARTCALLFLVFALCAAAQQKPAFDVSSVKPSRDASHGYIRRMDAETVSVASMTLSEMIQLFYSIRDFQLVGGPDWIRKERFDVTGKNLSLAKYSPNAGDNDNYERMKSLLEERFHLALHHETSTLPVLVLQANPRKHFSAVPCSSEYRLQHGIVKGSVRPSSLAALLTAELGIQVIDRTGLDGCYALDATWTTDPGDTSGTPVISAVHDLGFVLKHSKGAVDVLVVDRAEHPLPD